MLLNRINTFTKRLAANAFVDRLRDFADVTYVLTSYCLIVQPEVLILFFYSESYWEYRFVNKIIYLAYQIKIVKKSLLFKK